MDKKQLEPSEVFDLLNDVESLSDISDDLDDSFNDADYSPSSDNGDCCSSSESEILASKKYDLIQDETISAAGFEIHAGHQQSNNEALPKTPDVSAPLQNSSEASLRSGNTTLTSEYSSTLDDTTLSDVSASDATSSSFLRQLSRKRGTNQHLWKRNVQKKMRQEGKSYVSELTGKCIAAKKFNAGPTLCKTNCRFKCSEKLSISQRRSIFNHYYTLDAYGKRSYIFGCITPVPVKQKTLCDKPRVSSYAYAVVVDQVKVNICKDALCKLLSVSRQTIDTVRVFVGSGNAGPPPIMQGLHHNRPNRASNEVRNFIKGHISSFPAESSHYSRHENPNRKYLNARLSISKMYSLYVKECEQKQMPVQSQSLYRFIFCKNFNLGFGNPRSDTCSKCDSGNSTDEHKRNYKLGFDEMSKDREFAKQTDGVHYITFDLEKTLPLPKITTSIAFYLRQVSYNVTLIRS